MEIRSYLEAVSVEQTARNCIYLGVPYTLLGFEIHNITPRLMARLNGCKSPFLCGGSKRIEHVAQFIWVLSTDYAADNHRGRKSLVTKVEKMDLSKCCHEIMEFLDLTFLDSPTGKASTPYASSIAWMEYRMTCEPFLWDYDTKTIDVPLRRIYQLIRCWQLEQNIKLTNRISDKIAGDQLDIVNQALTEGIITAQDIDGGCAEAKINGACRAGKFTPKFGGLYE